MLTPEERKKTKWSWLVVLLVILGAIALFLGIDYLENGYNSVVFKFLESLQK